MSLCLVTDPWIPAIRNGESAVISVDRIAEPGISRLAWDRPDFNLACLELLVGLVSLVDPPQDESDWRARLNHPDADRLREALVKFAHCFSLSGDGPRFLQDLEAFEHSASKSGIKSVDMLYIDSAGASTVSKNADLMVKRNRLSALSPVEAAMALYTLQAFAPSGGAGNRTSMRGGGPMTTLVQPLDSGDGRFTLWRLVFANVLPGMPLAIDEAKSALPWLRPTRTSGKAGQHLTRDEIHPLEAFFGMPRRLRLVFKDDRVVGVVQKPYGTNYQWCEHPLTPYYRKKEDDPEWLPVHPRAGRLSYRNWLGVTMGSDQESSKTQRIAKVVHEYGNRSEPPDFELLVGGWAMDNMKPVDFACHRYPGFPRLEDDRLYRVHKLVDAAKIASEALRKALKTAWQLVGTAANSVTEEFFSATENEFAESAKKIVQGADENVEENWHGTLKKEAMRLFDMRIGDGLAEHNVAVIEKRITARRKLLGKISRQVRTALGLPIPSKA